MKKALSVILLISFVLLLLLVKGDAGDSFYFQKEYSTRILGPFELSNSTSRYALTEAIVENNTFLFDETLAKFSSPDVVEYKNKFFSIFTPGVSFIGVPFYALGKFFGMPQLFTYFSTILFAMMNMLLVAKFARKLGANIYIALLSGFTFLFATNALTYSLTYTQHHMSVFFILLSLLNALERRTFIRNLLLGVYFGMAILADIPNAIMLSPVILCAFFAHFRVSEIGKKINIKFNTVLVGILVGLIPLIILFGWYNFKTTGTFTKIGQTIGRTDYFKTTSVQNTSVPDASENTAGKPLINLPFQTRNQIGGFYTLLISNERSWIYYSPVLFIGAFGLLFAFKNRATRLAAKLGSAIVLVNIVAYSMFGDPWGGWAFGPRYLIPSAAILAAASGVVIQKFKKNPVFIILFIVLFFYSVSINTLGALTTNAVAPKIEAESFKPPIPYTNEYNLGFIASDQSGNLLYNVWLYRFIDLRTFWYVLVTAIIGISALIFFLTYTKKE